MGAQFFVVLVSWRPRLAFSRGTTVRLREDAIMAALGVSAFASCGQNNFDGWLGMMMGGVFAIALVTVTVTRFFGARSLRLERSPSDLSAVFLCSIIELISLSGVSKA